MAMSMEDHQLRSEQICSRLLDLIREHTFQTVAIYLSISSFNEPDLTLLLHHLSADGIQLQLPIVEGDQLTTVKYEVGMRLKKSYGGTKVPETIIPVDPTLAELILVPMLAADLHGFRLGYGKGYYDRYLGALFAERSGERSGERFGDRAAAKWGICFDEEVMASLLSEEHDQKIEAIVTDKRFIWCS
jgi:5-formyltetrahydrofolate cyclo-ligase